MYQCFHCLQESVGWDADFSFEDYGIDGNGIIHTLHCNNCGAEIEYYVPGEDANGQDDHNDQTEEDKDAEDN